MRGSSRPADHGEDGDLEHRQRHVEHPEPAGDRADRCGQPLDLGPRELRLEQLPSPDAQAREHGEGEHDDPHPAEPLGELAPHREAARQGVDVGEDGRAGRRHPGHGLEVGVERARELVLAREDVRERDEERGREPRDRDDEERLAQADPLAARGRLLEYPPGTARERPRGHEGPHRLAVPEGNRDREEERDAQVAQDEADEVERAAHVDAADPTPRHGPRAQGRQYPRMRSTATGTISSRPSHMSTARIPVERLLNGS